MIKCLRKHNDAFFDVHMMARSPPQRRAEDAPLAPRLRACSLTPAKCGASTCPRRAFSWLGRLWPGVRCLLRAPGGGAREVGGRGGERLRCQGRQARAVHLPLRVHQGASEAHRAGTPLPPFSRPCGALECPMPGLDGPPRRADPRCGPQSRRGGEARHGATSPRCARANRPCGLATASIAAGALRIAAVHAHDSCYPGAALI